MLLLLHLLSSGHPQEQEQQGASAEELAQEPELDRQLQLSRKGILQVCGPTSRVVLLVSIVELRLWPSSPAGVWIPY